MSREALTRVLPAPIPRQPSLLMSDLILLFGLLGGVFWFTDPLGWRLEKILLTKHLPFFVALVGVCLTLTGAALFSRRGAAARLRMLPISFPWVLLAIWIIGGSLYARFSLGEDNTFLISGMYMLTGILFAKAVGSLPDPIVFVARFIRFSAICALFMVVRMAVEFRESMVAYHELEFFVIPMAVYFMLRHERPTTLDRWAVTLFLISGIIFRKNTGFMVSGLVAIYLWVVVWRWQFKADRQFRHRFLFYSTVIAGSLAVVGGYLTMTRGEYLPSGNPQYRLVAYEVAWNKFIGSPLIGKSFTDAATEKFTGFDTGIANNVLPTHSDLLDIAAQGGTAGVLLLAWGYLRVFRSIRGELLADRSQRHRWALAHTLWCMCLTAIPVYIFNPIMLQPAKALVLWSLPGMLIGLSVSTERQINQHLKKRWTKDE